MLKLFSQITRDGYLVDEPGEDILFTELLVSEFTAPTPLNKIRIFARV